MKSWEIESHIDYVKRCYPNAWVAIRPVVQHLQELSLKTAIEEANSVPIQPTDLETIMRQHERRIERLVNRNMQMMTAYQKLRLAFADFEMSALQVPELELEPVEVNEQSR